MRISLLDWPMQSPVNSGSITSRFSHTEKRPTSPHTYRPQPPPRSKAYLKKCAFTVQTGGGQTRAGRATPVEIQAATRKSYSTESVIRAGLNHFAA